MPQLLIEIPHLQEIKALKNEFLLPNFYVTQKANGTVILNCFHYRGQIQNQNYFDDDQDEIEIIFESAGITKDLLTNLYQKFGLCSYQDVMTLKIELCQTGKLPKTADNFKRLDNFF
jgi:translation elongation factor EF-4